MSGNFCLFINLFLLSKLTVTTSDIWLRRLFIISTQNNSANYITSEYILLFHISQCEMPYRNLCIGSLLDQSVNYPK